MKTLCPLLFLCLTSFLFADSILAPKPPMGWNSFDSYVVHIHEKEAYANLKTFVETFKPLGYEYFVIDAGWYYEFERYPENNLPVLGKKNDIALDEYGRLLPAKACFPSGLKALADECHKHGVKLGVHIMRGIPRKAVELNTPIYGTKYKARDIADMEDICNWCPLNYGLDMTQDGAQAYYDGWIQLLADWGIDFIKADDIVEFPDEIDAVIAAIEKTGRKITLSLSPGDRVMGNAIKTYEKADMLRVTGDVWDRTFDIEKCFASWLTWQHVQVRPGFWFDMDMIPFGELRVVIPKDTPDDRVGNTGKHRYDRFTLPQKETFITMRAMSASPLMMGGVLPTLDKDSLRLLTNRDMIACNQNGIMGHMIEYRHSIQIWKTEEKGTENGWVAIFNRSHEKLTSHASLRQMGLDTNGTYSFKNIWTGKPYKMGKNELPAQGCLFLRYKKDN
ncbi:MAG: glycoside hydrolase family 27 protein [Planctomycetes bacterium]|nr:glycoside hydrolase family 27 protein [Planctomycetota bacterium]